MFDAAWLGVSAARRLRCPAVVTIHTVIKHTNPVYDAVLTAADRLLLKYAVIRRAQVLIAPDVNVREYIEQRFQFARSEVIPYGIALPEPDARRGAELCARFGLKGEHLIVSVGHVHALRDRVQLVRAFRRVVDQVPSARLVIVGSVSDRRAVDAVSALGLEGHVVFAGPLPHADVAALLSVAAMEAHWLNQDTPERTSLGVASMEAMSVGLTVLSAANVNTFGPGVLVDGQNVVIVDPTQPGQSAGRIIELLQDRVRRDRIGAAARSTAAEHFSWANVARRTASVYEQAGS
jgi:glycosyltransferase involved in cell wall biosynthesis